jgi:hypothetical protein
MFEYAWLFANVRKPLLRKGFSITLNLSERSGTTANLGVGYRDGYRMILLPCHFERLCA